MKIDDHALDDFIKAYEDVFDEKIDRAKASIRLAQLAELYQQMASTLPENKNNEKPPEAG